MWLVGMEGMSISSFKCPTQDLRLVMIDEVHHLGDATRGPTLEAVVSRLKIIDRSGFRRRTEFPLRFIAVSATIPNIEDVARWLGNDDDSEAQPAGQQQQQQPQPAAFRAFGSEYRPVKLRPRESAAHPV